MQFVLTIFSCELLVIMLLMLGFYVKDFGLCRVFTWHTHNTWFVNLEKFGLTLWYFFTFIMMVLRSFRRHNREGKSPTFSSMSLILHWLGIYIQKYEDINGNYIITAMNVAVDQRHVWMLHSSLFLIVLVNLRDFCLEN